MKRVAAVRLVACLMAACLVSSWLAVRSASASCGDYVMVGGHHEHGMPGAHSTRALSTTGHEMPCHGPNCSRRSAPSPSAPATVATGQQDWGLASEDVCVFHAEPVYAFRHEPRLAAVFRINAIFRPPPHV